MDIKKEPTDQGKIGDCGLCKKKDVEGETSTLWDFTCTKCLKIIEQWNALDNISFVRFEKN